MPTTIPETTKAVKPVRNPLTGNEPKAAPAPTQRKDTTPGTVPAALKVPVPMNRTVAVKAKDTCLCLSSDGHKFIRVEYTLPPTHTYDMLLDPSYWSAVSHRLKRAISTEGDFVGSILCCRPRDHSWYAELYITEVSVSGVWLEVLFKKNFGVQIEDVVSERFRVSWNDRVGGYDIIRKADNVVCAAAKEFKRLQSVKDWLAKMEG